MKWPLKILCFLPTITSSNSLSFTIGQNLRAESLSFPCWSWDTIQKKEKGWKHPTSVTVCSRKAGTRAKEEQFSASKPPRLWDGLDHQSPHWEPGRLSFPACLWNCTSLLWSAHSLPDRIQLLVRQKRGEERGGKGSWGTRPHSAPSTQKLEPQGPVVLFKCEWKTKTTEFFSSHSSSSQLVTTIPVMNGC